MAPAARLSDYVSIVVGAAVVCAFVFAVSTTYRTESQSSIGKSNIRSSANKSLRKSSSKPNIVFIMADDMGWNGIGYSDWSPDDSSDRYALAALSPNINSLASKGIAFTNYYSQEVCTPARAAFLTGRYPINLGMQFGVVDQYTPWGLNLSETTFAEVFQENGYDTHAIGKWHLGHFSPRYLPTARGFDTFTGYLDGDNYYFSKYNPSYSDYHDFTVANASCYGADANGTAYELYSTEYYTDLALNKINAYKDSSTPFFLYLAFQAVHNPFFEISFPVDTTYKEKAEVYAQNLTFLTDMTAKVTGDKTKEYAITLNIFDSAVQRIVDQIDSNGMFDNTYVVFASDNGGCIYNGGRNTPLQGSKSTLYEGGTKVDAFIYSPQLLSAQSGMTYDNLYHVSDWFPTLLGFAGISYTAPSGYALDGVSHYTALSDLADDDGDSSAPRNLMVYNIYTKVLGGNGEYDFDVNTDGVFAIRNSKYKLIHAFNGSILFHEYADDAILTDDAYLSYTVDCKQSQAYEGHYHMQLFDLENDPYEENNLYYSTDDDVVTNLAELYAEFWKYEEKTSDDTLSYITLNLPDDQDKIAEAVWDERDQDSIGPYYDADYGVTSAETLAKTYPSYCGAMSV